MRRTPIFSVIVLLVLAGLWWPVGRASAEWVAFSERDPSVCRVIVADPATERVVLEIGVPGVHLREVIIAGRPYTKVIAPGLAPLQRAGHPELPVLTCSVRIAPQGTPRLEILATSWREIPVAPVVPSKGHLSRTIDPATVPHSWAPCYAGGVFPDTVAVLARPFVLRGVRGVTVRINPFVYDADRGVLRVLEQMTIAVVTEGAGGVNSRPTGSDVCADPQFAQIQRRLFVNEPAQKYAAPRSPGPMLIITDAAFTTVLQPFVTWKQQRGIPVELVSVADVGPSPTQIKASIAERYESEQGLTYLVLVGDVDRVPTNAGPVEGADADGLYALLDGDDLYPDVLVSRISADSAEQVATQVAKFVRYERNPDRGADAAWYARASGVASDEGEPADSERADWLRDDLLGYTFSDVDRIYQGSGGSTSALRAALEQGRSLINYVGHGTSYGWTSVAFSSGDVRGLANGWRQPWIVDVSCYTGDFSQAECFAEAWLRAGTPDRPSGAVGVCAASAVVPWIPPTVMQAEVVDLLTTERETTIGALCASGLMKVLDIYAGLQIAAVTVQQYNLFGDCSLQVRTAIPAELTVSHPSELPVATTIVPVTVMGAGSAVVTLTVGPDLLGRAVTDAAGDATLVLARELTDGEAAILTVTAYNSVPYQVDIPVGADAAPIVIDDGELPAVVTLHGNHPNPFNHRVLPAGRGPRPFERVRRPGQSGVHGDRRRFRTW